jgi:putative transposase
MARKSVKFELTAEQEATLKMWAGSHRTQQRYMRRAQVILLSAQGLTLEEISARSGLNRTNCLKWRKRFAAEGVDGLKDKPRKGRPPTIAPWQRAQVVRLACEKPFTGANAWSRRELARVTGMGSTTVHRILAGASLKPHKVHHWCGKSPDPEFEPKQAAILGLYVSPPENALVLSVDEKSQIQALDRTQPELPLRPGNPKRQTATYTRHGTTCLLAALAVHEGTVEARCVDSNNRHVFLAFLKSLYRAHPHKHLHVIVDNLPLHKHPDVMEWVSRRRRLTLHFTPTYASWLNQIEIWFHIFSQDVVKGGVWRSKQELVDQIMFYIKRYNRDRAHPFTWTYTGKVLVA